MLLRDDRASKLDSTLANKDARRTISIGVVLLIAGPLVSYLLDRLNYFKVLENSRYQIAWADVFYPPLCAFLMVSGTVLVLAGLFRQATVRRSLPYLSAIAIPLTLLYTLFVFGMWFIDSGADRLGECPGLDEAAASSNVIPPSRMSPALPAVGCSVERRGLFLSDYNAVTVEGVTDMAEQRLVVEKIREQYHEAHTHPVQVVFRDKGTWIVRQGSNGTTFGSGYPGKIIRIVTIG